LMMILLGLFAGIALLLAAVGIYGAVAYSVAQRTGEIGVRIALGAQAADVLRLILGQGMMPVLIGLAAGIAAALALGRLLRTQLYQISPHNPTLLFTTAAVLALVALLACFVPARRAAHVDPIQALRAERHARFKIRSAPAPQIAGVHFNRRNHNRARYWCHNGDLYCR